jgi:glycosyltransferase involved in cell wall biosynthesis
LRLSRIDGNGNVGPAKAEPGLDVVKERFLSIPDPHAAAPLPREARPARGLISVVIPAFNEAAGLDGLLARLEPALKGLGTDWEIIFVDDGSSDNTRDKLKALNAGDRRIKGLVLSRNFGKENAMAAGLRYAQGDAVIVMDADLQHPPELIAAFVQYWQQGDDIVYGQRLDRAADSLAHRWAARVYYAAFRKLTRTVLPAGAGDFRLLDRKAVDAINSMGERARFTKGLYAWIGFRARGVPFQVPARLAGKSRWRPRELLRFGIDGLASFTTIPLKVWSYVGLLISLFAFCYAMIFLIKTLIYGTDVPGFPTLVISVMFFAGVQLLSLGIIGEYLGRVYEEVKGRPLFLVAEELGLEKEARPPRRTHAKGEA